MIRDGSFIHTTQYDEGTTWKIVLFINVTNICVCDACTYIYAWMKHQWVSAHSMHLNYNNGLSLWYAFTNNSGFISYLLPVFVFTFKYGQMGNISLFLLLTYSLTHSLFDYWIVCWLMPACKYKRNFSVWMWCCIYACIIALLFDLAIFRVIN